MIKVVIKLLARGSSLQRHGPRSPRVSGLEGELMTRDLGDEFVDKGRVRRKLDEARIGEEIADVEIEPSDSSLGIELDSGGSRFAGVLTLTCDERRR